MQGECCIWRRVIRSNYASEVFKKRRLHSESFKINKHLVLTYWYILFYWQCQKLLKSPGKKLPDKESRDFFFWPFFMNYLH